jgi:hypothetical protein
MNNEADNFAVEFARGFAECVQGILTGASYTLGAVMVLHFLGLL